MKPFIVSIIAISILSSSVTCWGQNYLPSSGNVSIGYGSPGLSILTVKGANSTEENVVNVSNFSDQDFNIRLTQPGATTRRTVIGPSTLNRFSLAVGVSTNEHLTIINGGSVGIGTTSPEGFQVNASLPGESAKGVSNIRMGVLGGTPRIILDAGSTPFEMDNNNGQFRIFIPGEVKMVVNSNGNVGIGTTSPNQKLTVNGTIYGKEVKVDLSVPGPDYVFEESYALPSLEEVKSYIDENKHLPEVPSAKEMEKNGINLSEMNMLLLKKVEEMTLYLIDLKKENESVRQELKIIKEDVSQLKK